MTALRRVLELQPSGSGSFSPARRLVRAACVLSGVRGRGAFGSNGNHPWFRYLYIMMPREYMSTEPL